VTIAGWSWLAGRVACRRVGCWLHDAGKSEEKRRRRKRRRRRVVEYWATPGVAAQRVGQSPFSHRPSYDLRATFLACLTSLFWSSPLHLVLPATRDSVSRDPIVEITYPETPFAKQPHRTNRNDNMLIGLVRDSVLQCFCHSCKAPLGVVGEWVPVAQGPYYPYLSLKPSFRFFKIHKDWLPKRF